MMRRKLCIFLIVMILSPFVQTKKECPLQCNCTDDFSIVKCWEMEKFPVFDFASKVKTLDLTHGNIKTIHENDVKAYENLEQLFISHNPLDCNHATTRTLKHFARDTLKLKSFDGHKIKCLKMMPVIKRPRAMAENNRLYPGKFGARPNVHFHNVGGRKCLTATMVAGVMCLTVLGLAAVAGLFWVIAMLIATKKKIPETEDPLRQMEEGSKKFEKDSTAKAVKEGTQGSITGNVFADSKEDYLREKMKTQRRMSQGYADGSGSSDEESAMVEINLND